jgi:hypothetical protein
MEEVRFLAEVVNESLSSSAVGQLGTVVKTADGPRFGGTHLNLGLIAGVASTGDLQLYGRKLDRSDYRELGAGLFTRF